ncbi:MAG: hypothetical protein ACOX8X_05265 [Methanomethylophilus sp.]|jgi:hypothetical protein
MAYWFRGERYEDLDSLMKAVRMEIDGYFGDSDLNAILSERGGITTSEGETFHTAAALKKKDPDSYRELRDDIIDSIVDGLYDAVSGGYLPQDVPYVEGTIDECK